MKIQRKHLIQLMNPFIDDFEYYKNAILENNVKYNLTSIKSDDFYEKHFLDSLSIYPLLISESYNSGNIQKKAPWRKITRKNFIMKLFKICLILLMNYQN